MTTAHDSLDIFLTSVGVSRETPGNSRVSDKISIIYYRLFTIGGEGE